MLAFTTKKNIVSYKEYMSSDEIIVPQKPIGESDIDVTNKNDEGSGSGSVEGSESGSVENVEEFDIGDIEDIKKVKNEDINIKEKIEYEPLKEHKNLFSDIKLEIREEFNTRLKCKRFEEENSKLQDENQHLNIDLEAKKNAYKRLKHTIIELQTINDGLERDKTEMIHRYKQDKRIFNQEKRLIILQKELDDNKDGTIDMNMIEAKCEIYYNLFIRIYDKLSVTKKRLDLYQLFLNRINSGIQLSVITLSIGSSFIQALDSKTYSVFFDKVSELHNLNETDIYDSDIITESGGIEPSEYSSIVSIATLSISTYSALIIAAERHFGLQQRETNVEKLKDLYTEPISRIKTNLELIRPWKYKSYYIKSIKKSTCIDPVASERDSEREDDLDGIGGIDRGQSNKGQEGNFDEDKRKAWISMVDKLDKEYTHIVDVKKELDSSFEKMINAPIAKKYERQVPRKQREMIEDIVNKEKRKRKKKRWCKWFCKGRDVDHTFDEDDLNRREDHIETDRINDKEIDKKMDDISFLNNVKIDNYNVNYNDNISECETITLAPCRIRKDINVDELMDKYISVI